MPVDLHQRLSEFSYGYGVTREVERLLASVGLRPTPFLPSLLNEAELGFDVAFDRPGAALLLQFKLGEALQRFRRTDTSKPAPPLRKPFWRFDVDTAEPDGQYDLLLKAEQAEAEVYYVAPRFTSWDRYILMFQRERILRRSLLIRPSEIASKLARSGEPDGRHRIVYDRSTVHVCSEAVRVEEVRAQDLAQTVRARVEQRGERADAALIRVYESLSRRREIKRPRARTPYDTEVFAAEPERQLASAPARLAAERDRRLQRFRSLAVEDGDAIFAAVGVEAWAVGSQLLAVTLD